MRSNWVPFFKLLPIVNVEAGVDEVMWVHRVDGRTWVGGGGEPYQLEWSRLGVRAFQFWQEVQPARQSTRLRDHRVGH